MRLLVQLLSLLVRGTALMLGLVGAEMAVTSIGGVFSDRLGLSLGTAIGICATAGYVMVVMFAMCLPETRGRDLAAQ